MFKVEEYNGWFIVYKRDRKSIKGVSDWTAVADFPTRIQAAGYILTITK